MPAVQNAQEVFNVRVPEMLASSPQKAKEVGAVFVFKISGDGGGRRQREADEEACHGSAPGKVRSERGSVGVPRRVVGGRSRGHRGGVGKD